MEDEGSFLGKSEGLHREKAPYVCNIGRDPNTLKTLNSCAGEGNIKNMERVKKSRRHPVLDTQCV